MATPRGDESSAPVGGRSFSGARSRDLHEGPDLMENVFTSSAPFEAERVGAVAIYCSDGRYGDAVDEFLHDSLGLPNYDRLAIAGGPAWIGLRSSASISQYGLVRDQLDFLVQVHALRRVVL